MGRYTAITIGPILETMSIASSPVALWASSYLFSLLSVSICEELIENGVSEKDIITPYYRKDSEHLSKNNGVGLFPDRIIFVSDGFNREELEAVKEKSLKKVAKAFGIEAEFLKEYVMMSSAEYEAENAILGSTLILDSLELAKAYRHREEINPILSLFSGDEYSKNSGLKKTELVKGFKDFQLKKTENSFLSLEEIVKTGSGLKKYEYYAIVRSDGDGMSNIIASLSGDREINEFSGKCLDYCSAAAELVNKYDGVTIYSGGDDLLAILPCESRSGLNIFDFLKALSDEFGKHFDGYNKGTSLSFGVTIAHYRFPLYEALEDSAYMLFDIAKKQGKNCAAVHLQKHAGQSEGLVFSNVSLSEVSDLVRKTVVNKQETEAKNKFILSALYKLDMFKEMFIAAEGKQIDDLFKNTFDAFDQKGNVFLEKELPNLFKELKEKKHIKAIDSKGVHDKDTVMIICYLLRVMKFFIEKEGEK